MKVIEISDESEESHSRHTTTSSDLTEGCAICLDRMHMACRMTGTCSHRFCFECFFNWTKIQNLCPLCQRRYQRFDCRIFSETQLNRFEGILVGFHRIVNTNSLTLRKLLKNPKWRDLDHFWHRMHSICFVCDSKIVILLMIDANKERKADLLEHRIQQIFEYIDGYVDDEEAFRKRVDSLLRNSVNNIHLMTIIVSDRRFRHFRKI